MKKLITLIKNLKRNKKTTSIRNTTSDFYGDRKYKHVGGNSFLLYSNLFI